MDNETRVWIWKPEGGVEVKFHFKTLSFTFYTPRESLPSSTQASGNEHRQDRDPEHRQTFDSTTAATVLCASRSTATRSTRGEDTRLQTSRPKHDDEGCSNTKRAVPASRNPHDRCRTSFGEGKGRIPEPSDVLRKRARCRCPATAGPLLRVHR